VLVETGPGVVEVCDCMERIAKEKPSVRYRVAETKTGSVDREMDATIRVNGRWIIPSRPGRQLSIGQSFRRPGDIRLSAPHGAED
jgi:hypothetical protein